MGSGVGTAKGFWRSSGSETPGVTQETRVEAMNAIGELSVLGTKIVLGIRGFATKTYAGISKVA